MKQKIHLEATLQCWEISSINKGYEINIEADHIQIAIKDDHIENKDGSITQADYGRSVNVELDRNAFVVRVYSLNQEEPITLKLEHNGRLEITQPIYKDISTN